ncbi:DUF2461 domain-containing protein [Pedobacter sp. MC2016-24]|uniref:DUF2461 domain-containing protein n=1 Tax=Pedobacter sp. MC2016-24 TaxID=2780090 RepID=UPI00187F690A|nr:DUF2461 domain-containing protein [Pedobacter sp. MC2016-24]MBE9598967.1 DUF2461 domain-containing protein [Pedobacter sp. MC2016-24]
MIQPETLAFITDVANNNNREWFAEHKDRYEVAKADVLQFVEKLIPLLAAADPEFSVETSAKKCLLRIYRDVRFSKNKDPYKNNYGISFAVKGKGVNEPGYYLHIQPGSCFFGAGFWMPEAADLKKIREEIDYNTSEFLEIIEARSFKNTFQLSQEDKLKKAPKGYESDHPQIELLKLKSFIATFPIKDEEFFKPAIVNQLKNAFESVYPFILFLRKAVAP